MLKIAGLRYERKQSSGRFQKALPGTSREAGGGSFARVPPITNLASTYARENLGVHSGKV